MCYLLLIYEAILTVPHGRDYQCREHPGHGLDLPGRVAGEQGRHRQIVLDDSRCVGCFMCIGFCPTLSMRRAHDQRERVAARALVEMRVAEDEAAGAPEQLQPAREAPGRGPLGVRRGVGDEPDRFARIVSLKTPKMAIAAIATMTTMIIYSTIVWPLLLLLFFCIFYLLYAPVCRTVAH